MNDHTTHMLQPVATKSDQRTKQKIYRDFKQTIGEIGILSVLGSVRRARQITDRLLKSHIWLLPLFAR